MSASEPFDAYGRYYDLLYRDKDYAAEVAYIDGLLRTHKVTGPALLELGSGTGRHGVLLAERGYQVSGIERSAEMVRRAPQAPGFNCTQGDILTARLGRRFDAVLALFHVLSYQVTNAAVHAAFARAAEHLMPGGLFLFDVWYTPAVLAQRPAVRLKRLTGDGIEVARIAEPVLYPNENRVDVNYTLFVRDLGSDAVEHFSESHPMRHFSLPELDLLAAMTGFLRVRAEAFMTGDEPGEHTWGVCVVLVKSAAASPS
jgi:SAM-dependent methyltransferase